MPNSSSIVGHQPLICRSHTAPATTMMKAVTAEAIKSQRVGMDGSLNPSVPCSFDEIGEGK